MLTFPLENPVFRIATIHFHGNQPSCLSCCLFIFIDWNKRCILSHRLIIYLIFLKKNYRNKWFLGYPKNNIATINYHSNKQLLWYIFPCPKIKWTCGVVLWDHYLRVVISFFKTKLTNIVFHGDQKKNLHNN